MRSVFSLRYAIVIALVLAVVAATPPSVRAQDDACPLAHSHQEGDMCICDDGYGAVAGACIPMEQVCAKTANSHPVGRECFCDDGFVPKGGVCAPLSDEEMCPLANSHVEGDQCICDDGYSPNNGACVSTASFCARFNAYFSAATNECECNEGYVEVPTEEHCVLDLGPSTVPPSDTPQPTDVPSSPLPIPSQVTDPLSGTTNDAGTPPPSFRSALDALLEGVTPDEATLVGTQRAALEGILGDVPALRAGIISPTLQESLENAKEVVPPAILVEQPFINADAEQKHRELEKKEAGLQEELTRNIAYVRILDLQSFTIEYAEHPGSGGFLRSDKEYQEMPKRDFLKEAYGDGKHAMILQNDAMTAQKELIKRLQTQLKELQEEKADQRAPASPSPSLPKLDLYKTP